MPPCQARLNSSRVLWSLLTEADNRRHGDASTEAVCHATVVVEGTAGAIGCTDLAVDTVKTATTEVVPAWATPKPVYFKTDGLRVI